MANSTDSSLTDSNSKPLDISELQNFNFGPSWTERKGPEVPKSRVGSRADRRPQRGTARRHSKGDQPPRSSFNRGPESSTSSGDRRRRGGHRDSRSWGTQEEVEPIVEVLFYPEDIPFKALCHAMRSNCRTYELFELARLILEKPERFVVTIHPSKTNPNGPKEFYCSVPDGLPFLSEKAALAHVFQKHVELFFEIEEIEVEPPKGHFALINRCGITGELLGPPNYHRYQTLLQEHHARHLPNVHFERFCSKIESLKEAEVVDQWIQKMTLTKRFKVKNPEEGEPETLESFEAAKSFLLNKRRDQVVRTKDHVRFSGQIVKTLPEGELRRTIEQILDQQQHFPLDTANNLRGRLRRMRFTIYKRGTKRVSFVCAVKRNFRDPRTVFSDSLQTLIECIENHQNISVGALPEAFLGIQPKKKMKTEVERVPDIDEVSKEDATAIVEVHEVVRQQRLEAAEKEQGGTTTNETPDVEKATPVATNPPLEPESVEQKEPPVVDAKMESAHSPSDDLRIRQMMTDLRWLVTEGFVVELGDGKLFAVPALHPPSASSKDPMGDEPSIDSEPIEPAVESASENEVTSEPPVAPVPLTTPLPEA